MVKANRIIQYFGQNEKKYPLPLIMGNLYSFFTKLLKTHYVVGKSNNEIGSFIGVHPYFVKDYQIGIRHYDRKKLVSIISILKEYDLKSKGMDNLSIPNKELLKEMVYKIMN